MGKKSAEQSRAVDDVHCTYIYNIQLTHVVRSSMAAWWSGYIKHIIVRKELTG